MIMQLGVAIKNFFLKRNNSKTGINKHRESIVRDRYHTDDNTRETTTVTWIAYCMRVNTRHINATKGLSCKHPCIITGPWRAVTLGWNKLHCLHVFISTCKADFCWQFIQNAEGEEGGEEEAAKVKRWRSEKKLTKETIVMHIWVEAMFCCPSHCCSVLGRERERQHCTYLLVV